MNKIELTTKIKEKAGELGFTLAGVTTADPPDHLDFFHAWLNKGYHAEMEWIGSERSIHRRSDPGNILPECRSILVLGCPYPAPRGNINGGNIASYALNQDYHEILEKKLKVLTQSIEKWIGKPVPNRYYVDTGPVMEKELAMRAGLGWIGKNTTLINPELGSYFFISEILLGIDLVIDQPIKELHCGTCTRCLDTCPTGALVEAYSLDANRCISYLTIEHRGPVPEDLRNQMGDWIFGCDICQIVCPWNKPGKGIPSILEALEPRKDLLEINPIKEIRLNQEEFSARYRGSPIKRAKRVGFLRNLAIALGNRGEIDAVKALEESMLDNEPLVQTHAKWALEKIRKKNQTKIEEN